MVDGPKTKAAVVVVNVGFREISAMYDLYDGRRVLGPVDNPRVVYRSAFFNAGVGAAAYEDEIGQRVHSVKAGDDLQGVYRAQRVMGTGTSLCTFARKRSTNIDQKWVYVFSSTSKSGDVMRLEKELLFEKGSGREVDLVKEAGKDTRTPGSSSSSMLNLEIRTLDKPGIEYFFLLAPYQIPWAGLQAMIASGKQLAARCQRLFDLFWTDGWILTAGEPKPLFEMGQEVQDTKPMAFVMHLVDSLKEGLRRAELYEFFLGLFQEVLADKQHDGEYRLAKRIEIATFLKKDQWEIVEGKLGAYLLDAEPNVRLMTRLVLSRLEDLMRWIGETHQGDSAAFLGSSVASDTFYLDGAGHIMTPVSQSDNREWVNPFSAMVAAYNDLGTPDDVMNSVGFVVLAVHAHLNALPRGQQFLARMVHAYDTTAWPAADGGSGLLFENKRKSLATVTESMGGLLEHYVPKWIEVYKTDSLPKLIEFARKQHNLDLKKIKPAKLRGELHGNAKRTHKQLSKLGQDALANHYHIALEEEKVTRVKSSSRAMNRLMIGIETFNMKLSIQAMIDQPDRWAAIGLLGSSLDAFGALSKVWPKLEEAHFTFGGLTRALKVTKILGVISASIDTVLGVRDVVNSTNYGQQTGHIVRTVGAAMTVGGAALSATPLAPLGAVLTILGLALEAAGSWFVSQFSDMAVFLRHSRFGSTSKVDTLVDWRGSKNGFGYTGKLDDLAANIPAQLRAIDWLFFAFTVDFDAYDGTKFMNDNRIFMKVAAPKGLGPTAKWQVKLEVVHKKTPDVIRKWEFASDDPYDNADMSSGDQFSIASVAPARQYSDQTTIREAWGDVTVRGKVTLDAFGDGQNLVTLDVDDDVSTSW